MRSRIAQAWNWCRSYHCIILFLACLGFPWPAISQTVPDGSIRGIIRDQQSAILPGVTVNATSATVPGIHVATTDSTGLYRLTNLPPGEYTITVTLANFAPFIRDHVVARAGLNIGLDVVLQVGQVEDAVHVVADTPLLESKSATTAVNISGEFQRNLPMSPRRNWSDALLVTPGVVSADETVGGLTQNYYVHGSNYSSHVFQVDGADVGSATIGQAFYIALNPDLIADVQIKTAGVDASAPLGTGAVLNVATRSGTNTFSGAATEVFQSTRWNNSNVPGGTSPKVGLAQPDLSLGGPILRDRLWFFGAFRRTDAVAGVARTPSQISALSALDPAFTAYDLTNKANLYFLKLNATATSAHHLSGFYQSDFVRTDSGGAQDAVPSTSQLGGRAVAGRVLSTWGTALTSELGVSYNDKTFETPEFGASGPSQQVYRSVAVSGGRWQGNDLVGRIGAPSTVWTSQPAQKATASFDTTYYTQSAIGRHELKSGVLLQPRLLNESNVHYVNGGAALEQLVLANANDPSAGVVPFRRSAWPESTPQYRSMGSDLAFYAQDTWTLERLTTTFGVRVDRVKYKDTIFDVTTQSSVDVGPRVGINYALGRNGRSVARFTWSRVPDRVAGAAFAGTVTATETRYYDLNLDGTFETVDVIPGSSSLSPSRLFDANLHQPYVNELTAGYRQQFRGQVTVDVGVVRRLLKERFAMVDTNGIYEGNVFKGYRDESQNEIYRATNNIWNWPIYTALELTATKRTAWIELIGSYTRQWQHLAGTWQPNDPASFIQPAAFPNDRQLGLPSGSSLSSPTEANSYSSFKLDRFVSSPWRDHLVRLGASAHAPWGLSIAVNYTYQSGPWSGPILMRLVAADPALGPSTIVLSNGRVAQNPLATVLRFAYATRGDGQFQLHDYHVLNLRLTKEVAMGGRRRLAVMADVYNATNNAADQGLISQGNVLGSANFGVGSNRQVPRGAQLSVRFIF
jgi:hypothetical protein